MSLDRESILNEIDAVLERCGVTDLQAPSAGRFNNQTGGWIAERSAACLALLERLAGPNSIYRQAAQEPLDNNFLMTNPYALAPIIGAVLTFRADVEAGFTRTTAELIHADVFADFLEMAGELLQSGYKDPAAVVAGSVLEERLRQLGEKHGVEIRHADGNFKKADTLNADLAKAGVYNKLELKQVTAWLDLRNKAAHGQYGEYDQRQVESMIGDVRSFTVRHPA